jgi:hypothetical protein
LTSLSEIIFSSIKQFEEIRDNIDYQMVHDVVNKKVKFIRKLHITESNTPEELISISSIQGDPLAVISFKVYTIFDHEIAIPINIQYQVKLKRSSTNLFSNHLSKIDIPTDYQHVLQELLISSMTAELKAHDHPFYHLMCEESVPIEKIIQLYSQREENTVTKKKALMFVSKLLINYFQDHGLYENTVRMSDFLFRYFALSKVPFKLIYSKPCVYFYFTLLIVSDQVVKMYVLSKI